MHELAVSRTHIFPRRLTWLLLLGILHASAVVAADVVVTLEGGSFRYPGMLEPQYAMGTGTFRVRVSNRSQREVRAVSIRFSSSQIDWGASGVSPPNPTWQYRSFVLSPPLLPKGSRVMKVRSTDLCRYLTLEVTKVTYALGVEVNGELLAGGRPPREVRGMVYVPLADIASSLRAETNWDARTRTTTVTYQSRTLVVEASKNTALVDGRTVRLSAAPVIDRGTVMLPARLIREGLGVEVGFDAERSLVTVATDRQYPASLNGTATGQTVRCFSNRGVLYLAVGDIATATGWRMVSRPKSRWTHLTKGRRSVSLHKWDRVGTLDGRRVYLAMPPRLLKWGLAVAQQDVPTLFDTEVAMEDGVVKLTERTRPDTALPPR